MKKTIFILMVFLFSVQINAQTWTVRWDDDWDCEWRLITHEQWTHLVEQRKLLSEYAIMDFVNVLELEGNESLPVLQGERPPLNGQYYLVGTIIPKTEKARLFQNYIGYTQMYKNCNDQTGEFFIIFFNENGITEPEAIYIKSKKYNDRYVQCLNWVNGE